MLLNSVHSKEKEQVELLLLKQEAEKAFCKSVGTHLHCSDETHYYTCTKGIWTFSVPYFLAVFPLMVCRPPLRHPACVTSLWPSVTCNNAQCQGEICLPGNTIISETFIWGPGMYWDLWALTYRAGMATHTRNDAFLQKVDLILLCWVV